jgi:hypothetical protein
MKAAKMIKDDSMGYNYLISLLPGGDIEVRYQYNCPDSSDISNKITEIIESQMPKAEYFWRATNNKQEIELIKYGKINPSRDQRDGKPEKGLSVSENFGYCLGLGYKYGYRIKGKVISLGTDGEPILDINSLQPLDKFPRTAASIEKKEKFAFDKKLDAILAKYGWSHDDYFYINICRVSEEKWDKFLADDRKYDPWRHR